MGNTSNYISKLTSTSFFSFVKINGLGLLSTVLFGIVGFSILSKTTNSNNGEAVSSFSYLISIIFSHPYIGILFLATLLASPILFFVLGNKYIIKKFIYNLLNDKSEDYLNPFLDKVLNRAKITSSELLVKKQKFANIKENILNVLKNESDNKWMNKITALSLKTVKLDDIDYSNEESICAALKPKIIQSIQDFAKPDRMGIFLLVAAQWVILLFIWLQSN